ncbi:hypothetical protein ARMGADRAFT_949000, partial [Armillaria gallica]
MGFDPEKKGFANLSADNYGVWAPTMESLLKTHKLWMVTGGFSCEPDFVDADNPTKEEKREWRDWMEEMGAAAGMIFLCLDDTQKINVEDYRRHDDPVGMWTSLKVLHHQKTMTTRFTAYDTFFSVRKDPDESLSALHARVVKIMADVRSLRPSNFNLSKLDEELQIMALIHALP